MPPQAPGNEVEPAAVADLQDLQPAEASAEEETPLQDAQDEAIDHELPAAGQSSVEVDDDLAGRIEEHLADQTPPVEADVAEAAPVVSDEVVNATLEQSGADTDSLSPELRAQVTEALTELEAGSEQVRKGMEMVAAGQAAEEAAGLKFQALLAQPDVKAQAAEEAAQPAADVAAEPLQEDLREVQSQAVIDAVDQVAAEPPRIIGRTGALGTEVAPAVHDLRQPVTETQPVAPAEQGNVALIDNPAAAFEQPAPAPAAVEGVPQDPGNV